VIQQELHIKSRERVGGYLELKNADVEWFLSINIGDVPQNGNEPVRTYRSITIDGNEIEFSGGFTDLHTRVYEDILAGGGYGIDDARPSIETVYAIRTLSETSPSQSGFVHPYVKKYFSKEK